MKSATLLHNNDVVEVRRKEAQLREPPKKMSERVLPSHFVVSTKPVAKPTFSQRREALRLRDLSMKKNREDEFEPGWRHLISLLSDTFMDYPEMTPDVPNINHPLYWRALGFSGHDPNTDFQKYEHPIDGQGIVCAESEFVRGPVVTRNAYREQPLSPLNSRYRGGILTQQCILHFIESYPEISRAIISRRRRGTGPTDLLHYNVAFVAMEVTRVLALAFHLILTRVQEPPNYPLQPDMHVTVPFDVDYIDRSAHLVLPMSSIWNLLSEPQAFQRLHSLAMIAYDAVYTFRDARVGNTYAVLNEVEQFVHECMGTCDSLRELETVLMQMLGSRYKIDMHSKLCLRLAEQTVQSVITLQLQEAGVRQAEKERERRALAESRRLERREGLRMEEQDRYRNCKSD